MAPGAPWDYIWGIVRERLRASFSDSSLLGAALSGGEPPDKTMTHLRVSATNGG
jgi:hypothetical protein